jgi:hypothetical protein
MAAYMNAHAFGISSGESREGVMEFSWAMWDSPLQAMTFRPPFATVQQFDCRDRALLPAGRLLLNPFIPAALLFANHPQRWRDSPAGGLEANL